MTTSPHKRLGLITESAKKGVRSHYEGIGNEPTQPPLMVPATGACENVLTLFRIAGASSLYLSQTGQLSLEVNLQENDGVFCEGFSFRDDKADERHLNQFCLIEEEFTCAQIGVDADSPAAPHAMFKELLERITSAVCSMFRGVLDDCATAVGADYAHVEHAVAYAAEAKTWPSITYRNALERLNSAGVARLAFGDDLEADHEKALIELVNVEYDGPALPVFVTHYPEGIKFFNMKVDPSDPSVVLSADLLLPFAGESVGSAVREDDFKLLVKRLESSTMLGLLEKAEKEERVKAAKRNPLRYATHVVSDYLRSLVVDGSKDDGQSESRRYFDKYLSLMESGRVPLHAGYGIGLERVLQFIFRATDIRDVSQAHQLYQQLA